MGLHTITLPDPMHGREARTILWDDEAGTVSGNHSGIATLQRYISAPKPVTVGDPGGTWDLSDPGHDPTEMLIALYMIWWPALDEPLRSTLPAIFDGLGLPDWESREILYIEVDGELVAG